MITSIRARRVQHACGLLVIIALGSTCAKNEQAIKGRSSTLNVRFLPSRSIHIGLSKVKKEIYGSWNGTCLSCLDDARWYCDTATANGYVAAPPLEDEAATGDAILAAIKDSAEKLRPTGGTLLITFDGHGALIPPDAPTSRAWCAYDRQVLDDELMALLVNVGANVRVIIISDSCYSGGMLKKGPTPEWITADFRSRGGPAADTLTAMPRKVQAQIWERDQSFYLRLLADAAAEIEGKTVLASVILLAGAGPNGIALQSLNGGHSTFTQAIVDTFQVGKPVQSLFDDARAETVRREPSQMPIIETIGSVPRQDFGRPVFPPN